MRYAQGLRFVECLPFFLGPGGLPSHLHYARAHTGPGRKCRGVSGRYAANPPYVSLYFQNGAGMS